MKKMLNLFFVFCFFVNSTHIASAQYDYFSEETKYLNASIENSKQSIQAYKGGLALSRELYKVDNFVNSISDEAVLNKLLNRISVLENKYNSDLALELLNYIRLVIEKRLDTLVTVKALNIIKEIEKSNLSSEDIKKVDTEIVKLQLSLLNSSKTFLNKVSEKMKEYLYLEETGNIKINVSGSGAMFGSASGYLNMTDYKVKTANFDSEFEAQVDLLIDAGIKGEEAFKAQFSSFVNYISKDGNLYVLFNKLTYSGIDDKEINKYLNKLQELAKSKTFLKIGNEDSVATLDILKGFDLINFYSNANKALSNPMFKAYKKDGNKYYLYPTKHACNTIQYIQYKFFKYGNPTCSDTQYLDMLKSSIKNGDYYININGRNNYFAYDIDYPETKGYAKIFYSNDLISEIDFKIEPKSTQYAEYMVFHFVKGKLLDYVANFKSEDIYISFKSLLDFTNKFSKIDFVGNTGDFKSKFRLINQQFSGNFESVLKSYNYDNNSENFSELITGKLTGTITGTLDNSKNLSSLNLSINSNNNGTKYDYNYKTAESKMLPNASTFNLNYNLNSGVIAGTISYKENGKESFGVISKGKYSPKKYFELNNTFSFVPDETTYKGSMNLMSEGDTIGEGKFNFYFDIYSNGDYLKIDIKSNRNTIQNSNKHMNINAPTNSIDVEKVFSGKIINLDY